MFIYIYIRYRKFVLDLLNDPKVVRTMFLVLPLQTLDLLMGRLLRSQVCILLLFDP